jgi:hypothetical protein
MKLQAKKTNRAGLNTTEAKCPHCGYWANMDNAVEYCAGCGATHEKKFGKYYFDDEKIHPMFRAQQAGGMRIGR